MEAELTDESEYTKDLESDMEDKERQNYRKNVWKKKNKKVVSRKRKDAWYSGESNGVKKWHRRRHYRGTY